MKAWFIRWAIPIALGTLLGKVVNEVLQRVARQSPDKAAWLSLVLCAAVLVAVVLYTRFMDRRRDE